MFVNEIFYSLQGECLLQGAPTVFVRFAGCNLKCEWCDSGYAQSRAGSSEMSPSAIVAEVSKHVAQLVCLTGGEPLIQSQGELRALLGDLLRVGGRNISIETNGSQSTEWVVELRARHGLQDRISLTVDYKLASSGVTASMRRCSYLGLRPGDVLKFVCSDLVDARMGFSLLEGLVNVHGCAPTVFFHSVGGSPRVDIAEFVLAESARFAGRFDIRVGVQLHKLLWGNEKGR